MSAAALETDARTHRVLRAGALLAIAQVVATGVNYLINLLLGRWLSPAGFADASVMVTLMLLVSGAVTGLQLVTAREITLGTDGARSPTRLYRLALLGGLGAAVLLGAGAPWWQQILHTSSAWPFVILALGLPLFLLVGVGRGQLQGHEQFTPLAASYLVEALARAVVTIGCVLGGLSPIAAAAGLSASFLATALYVQWRAPDGGLPLPSPDTTARAVYRHTAVLLSAQAIAANTDVLIAKHALASEQAARYAAVAMIGRAVFFLAWALSAASFGESSRGDDGAGRSVVRRIVLVVLVVGALCSAAAALLGDALLTGLLGPRYQGLGLALAGYALATTFFAVANTVAVHYLAMARPLGATVLLAGALIQTLSLLVIHNSIGALIWVQIVATGILMITLMSVDRYENNRGGGVPA